MSDGSLIADTSTQLGKGRPVREGLVGLREGPATLADDETRPIAPEEPQSPDSDRDEASASGDDVIEPGPEDAGAPFSDEGAIAGLPEQAAAGGRELDADFERYRRRLVEALSELGWEESTPEHRALTQADRDGIDAAVAALPPVERGWLLLRFAHGMSVTDATRRLRLGGAVGRSTRKLERSALHRVAERVVAELGPEVLDDSPDTDGSAPRPTAMDRSVEAEAISDWTLAAEIVSAWASGGRIDTLPILIQEALRADHATLAACVARLSWRRLQCLDVRVLQGLSIEESAAELGRSVDGAQMLYRETLRMLVSMLRHAGGHDARSLVTAAMRRLDASDEVQRHFAVLSPRQQQILVLRLKQDLSYADIAREMGISNPRELLFRAIDRFAGLLVDETVFRPAESERDVRMLGLAAEGRSSVEIGATVGLTAGEVLIRTMCVASVLGVRNRVGAVAAAVREGILDVRRLSEVVPAVRDRGLSDDEVELLRLVARGLSEAEIGNAIGMPAHVVDRRLAAVGERFGTCDRMLMVVAALREGILDPNRALPEHEAGMLNLLAKGASEAEIATRLDVSMLTVVGLWDRLEARFGTRDRDALVLAALRERIIDAGSADGMVVWMRAQVGVHAMWAVSDPWIVPEIVDEVFARAARRARESDAPGGSGVLLRRVFEEVLADHRRVVEFCGRVWEEFWAGDARAPEGDSVLSPMSRRMFDRVLERMPADQWRVVASELRRWRSADPVDLPGQVRLSFVEHMSVELGVDVTVGLDKRRRPARSRDELSEAERRVLGLAAEGLSSKEIATHLGISPRFVKLHMSLSAGKLGTRGWFQTAVMAERRGFTVAVDLGVARWNPEEWSGDELSEGELAVLRLAAKWPSNQVIAATLGISPEMVHHRLARIGRKLGNGAQTAIVARTARAAIVVRAWRLGILTDDDLEPPARTLESRYDDLSDQEVEVLRMVVAGLTDAAMAAELGVSPQRMRHCRFRLYSKLGTRDPGELAFASALGAQGADLIAALARGGAVAELPGMAAHVRAVKRARHSDVLRCVEGLDPGWREYFVRWFTGQTSSDIAEARSEDLGDVEDRLCLVVHEVVRGLPGRRAGAEWDAVLRALRVRRLARELASRDREMVLQLFLRRLSVAEVAAAAGWTEADIAELQRRFAESLRTRAAEEGTAALLLVQAVWAARPEWLSECLPMLTEAQRADADQYFGQDMTMAEIAEPESEAGEHRAVRRRLVRIAHVLVGELPTRLWEQFGRPGVLRRATRADVAREAETGVKTVKSVLGSGGDGYSSDTVERMAAAAARLGWVHRHGGIVTGDETIVDENVSLPVPTVRGGHSGEDHGRGEVGSDLEAVRAADPDEVTRRIPDLRPAYQEIAQLLFQRGLSPGETAAILGRRKNSIKKLQRLIARDLVTLLSGRPVLSDGTARALIQRLQTQPSTVLTPYVLGLTEAEQEYFELFFVQNTPVAELRVPHRLTDDALRDRIYGIAQELVRKLPAELLRQQLDLLTEFGLSELDVRILGMAAEGKTNAEIGSAVDLTKKVLEVRLARIGDMLGTRNRTATVAAAIREGILDGHRLGATGRGRDRGLLDSEVEMLRLLARGLSRETIGIRTGMSERSVTRSIARIGDKLGTSDRLVMVVTALREGILDPNRAMPDRAVEVLVLLAEGLSDPEIAARLDVPPWTMQLEMNRLAAAFGTRDRNAIVVMALRERIIDHDTPNPVPNDIVGAVTDYVRPEVAEHPGATAAPRPEGPLLDEGQARSDSEIREATTESRPDEAAPDGDTRPGVSIDPVADLHQ